jgi:hypothetical protein
MDLISTRKALFHLMLFNEANNLKNFVLQATTTSCAKKITYDVFMNLIFTIFKRIKLTFFNP